MGCARSHRHDRTSSLHLLSCVQDWYRASDDRASGKDNVGARVYRYLIGRGEDRITGAMAGWSALGRGGLGATRCLFITCERGVGG